MKIQIEKTMNQDKRTHCKICDGSEERGSGSVWQISQGFMKRGGYTELKGREDLTGSSVGGPVGKGSDMIETIARREEALSLVEDTASRSVFQRHSHFHHLLTVGSWEGYLTAPCLMFSPVQRR